MFFTPNFWRFLLDKQDESYPFAKLFSEIPGIVPQYQQIRRNRVVFFNINAQQQW
jgi:hypothetical protein